MSASIYGEKLAHPTDEMLTIDLGETRKYFDEIAGCIEYQYGHFRSEWKYYGQKIGWLLKMYHHDRNVLFVIPGKRYFRASFTFGAAAVAEVLDGELPDAIKDDLSRAKKYAEGRTIQVEVKSKADVSVILELIRVKLTH